MSEIPGAAIEAATRLLFDRGWTLGDPERTDDIHNRDIADALAAAEPAFRAHIAGDVDALQAEAWKSDEPCRDAVVGAYIIAAEIIRDPIARRVGGADAGGGE